VRILIGHNFQQFSGGEDRAVEADRELLAAHGHETRLYSRNYDEVASRAGLTRLSLAGEAVWSRTSYAAIRALIREWRPHVAHFHNIFPLISASAYYACRAEGVPVVQTLHNYRLVCAAGTLLRDGKVCELCVGRAPWPAVRYRCYRGSRAQSVAMATALGGHGAAGTWRTRVDAYIALTEFARKIFARGGLPEDRLFIRPNAVATREPLEYLGPHSAIFAGRLSPEKGITTLLDAWERLPDIPLLLVGGGPLLSQIQRRISEPKLRHVTVTGELPHSRVLELIGRAGMLIFPSVCYEGLPYVALEALAEGVPVIASDIGTQAEIVSNDVSGLLFRTGDAESLVDAVTMLRGREGLAARLAQGARRDFNERYSLEQSYTLLMQIYRAIGAQD